MKKNKKLLNRSYGKPRFGRIFFAIALFLVVVLGVLLATHVLFHHKAAVVSGSAYTKGEGIPSNSTQQKGNDVSKQSSSSLGAVGGVPQSSNQENSTTSSQATLVAPFGDFVSAHQVHLSSPLVSVCNTTPGAKCQITFTSGDGTKKLLSAETTDSNGSVYWNNWTPASIGLTPGTWTVQATAILSSQTKSAQDAMNIMVSM